MNLNRTCRTFWLTLLPCVAAATGPVYLNPVDVAADGGQAWVALAGPSEVAMIDLSTQTVRDRWKLPLPPSGLAARDHLLLVALGATDGKLCLIDRTTGTVEKIFPAGFSPVSPLFIGRNTAAVCNRFTDEVSFFDLSTGTLKARIPVTRQPISAVYIPQRQRLYVGCRLPAQPATDPHVATTIEIIDTARMQRIKTLLLPNGSTGLNRLAASPDGKVVAATHILAHHQVPTTQLERGWMNANALTLIDTEKETLHATLLLDDVTAGAANPYDVDFTPEGDFLLVTHAGTRELSRIPFRPLLDYIAAYAPGDDNAYGEGLKHELRTMQSVGRTRIALPGEGSRAMTVAGRKALVCEYFSGTLAVIRLDVADPVDMELRRIPLGDEPPMDLIRRGEWRFHDARLCFQRWQSCVSCHPDMRTDALNWDLLNDGIGNPKQTKSMLYAHRTPPAMATGIRKDAETAVRAGIRFIQFAEVNEEDAAAIDAFLRSLEPLPSPFLEQGVLSASAQRGAKHFEALGCAACHPPPLFSDLQGYDIGHSTRMDQGRTFDTPVLIEIWRTAPYLYDGRAASLEEALRIHDPAVETLKPEEMGDLLRYLNSL